MKVIKVSQQGFCSGVKRALSLVDKTIKDNASDKQIFILGDIINNRFISNELHKKSVITIPSNGRKRVEMLKEIKDGIVILTAHGVSPEVIKYLDDNNIEYVDATCPFVLNVHDRIKRYLDNDYTIIYVGKHNHPESEGVLGINYKKIKLVTRVDDIKNINIKNDKILIDTQTTLSNFYTKPIIDDLLLKYPQALVASGVCDATTIRQEALLNELEGDLCLVVGDQNSSNANELLQIAKRYMPAYLINHVSEIKKEWLLDVNVVTLTSAASTPSVLTDEIYEFLVNYTWFAQVFFLCIY